MLTRTLKNSLLSVAMALCSSLSLANGLDQQVEISKASDNRTLTVRYTGAKAVLVELRINGVSTATRNVNEDKSTGETNFSLDSAKLASGENKIEIRLYDKSGRLVGNETTTIVVDTASGSTVFLAKPTSGSTVQGFVEISVGFKSELKGAFVSFFVNNEFKALKNFAPYTYLWDTNTVTNGWHEVEAWVVDESSNTFRTQRMRVFVNNPNGKTERINGSNQKSSGHEPREGLVAKVEKPATPAKNPSMTAVTHNWTKPTLAKVKSSKPVFSPAGSTMGERTMRPTGQRIAGSARPKLSTETLPQPPIVNVSGTEPATTAEPNVAMTNVNTRARAASSPMVTVTSGTKLPNIGYFPITLNGTAVKFDVKPRVRNGVALTPFRHLFEHAGGKVTWENSLKKVSGKTDGTALSFIIGDGFAMLNGLRVELEETSFLESGRAIVPLSFVQSALNLNVQFDPRSRHVLITKSDTRKS